MEYRMIWDYHTHTTYSHGKGSVEDNIVEAVKKGLKEIAISEHGPGHLTYGVSMAKMRKIKKEIERLRPRYPEIKIKIAVEANITTKHNLIDVEPRDMGFFDFVLAGYHYGILGAFSAENFIVNQLDKYGISSAKGAWGRSLLLRNTDMVVKALYENNIFMLTHPGDKGPFDILELAKACSDTGTLMEISNWHPHLDVEGIKIASATDVKFAISSDAHSPKRVGGFTGGLKRALKAGLDIERLVNIERA